MKIKVALWVAALLLISCKQQNTGDTTPPNDTTTAVDSIDTGRYPTSLLQVLDAHGDLSRWKAMRSLTFTMPQQRLMRFKQLI